jgi:hypothetical protein
VETRKRKGRGLPGTRIRVVYRALEELKLDPKNPRAHCGPQKFNDGHAASAKRLYSW